MHSIPSAPCGNDRLHAAQVVFKVKGQEKTHWQEERSHTQYNSTTKSHDTIHEWHTRADCRKFFVAQVQLYAWPQTCIPGQYQFPFSFNLPRGLPGSFSYEGHGRHRSRDVRSVLSYEHL